MFSNFNQFTPYSNNPQFNQNQMDRMNMLQNYNNQFNQSQPIQQGQPIQQVQQVQQAQPQGAIIRPVTSMEEVRGITPNFDGSKMYFEDITSGKMYVKYLGINGLPVLDVFTKEIVEEPQNTYVSKSEFDELKAKIAQYETIFNDLMGGNTKNEQ